MKVCVPSRKDSHVLEWACEWHIQDEKKKRQATCLGSFFVGKNHRVVMGDC